MAESKKIYHRLFLARVTLLFSFVLFSTFLKAQEHTEADTTFFKTTSPAEDDINQGAYHFLKKSEGNDPADSLQLRHLPAGRLKQMQQDEDFWYANAKVKRQNDNDNELVITTDADTVGHYNTVTKIGKPLVMKKWFQTLLWILIIGGFAGFIMVYLANSDTALFRRRNKAIAVAADEETETTDIFAINYQKEIDKAIRNGNYRLATRLMFLRLLKNLSDKHIIQYKQDRTNFDYLLQLNPTAYYKDFFRITRNYEYSWYGQLEVNADAFVVIKKDFENFEQKLG